MARNDSLGMLFVPILAGVLSVGCGSDDPAPDPGPKEQGRGSVLDDLAAAQPRDVVLDGRAVILTGSPGDAYYELSRALRVAGDDRAPALVSTGGSLDTMQLLAFGRGDAGLVQADVLQDPSLRPLRAALADQAMPLFSEQVHVLVGAEGPQTLLELAGTKVGVGSAGSGSATTAANLFWAAGAYDIELVPGAFADQVAALEAGELSALVAVGAQPMLGLRDAGLKVMDLGEERDAVLGELQKIHPGYEAGEVSAEFGGPAQTVAVPALLVMRAGYEGALELGGDVLHPAGRGLTLSASATPASLEGSSLTLRDPESPLRLVGEDAGLLGLLSRAWTAGGAEVRTQRTDALAGLALLLNGEAEAALVREDLLLEAMTRPETARVAARIQVAAPLSPVDLYLVQPAGGPLTSDPASMRGADKHLALGGLGSSTGASTRRILRLLRVLPEHYVGHLEAGTMTQARLRTGAPVAGEEAIALGEQQGYQALEDGGLRTHLHLVVRRELPSEQVQALVAALYANRKNLTALDGRFETLDPAQLETLPEGLSLHPGAAAASTAGIEPDSADPWE